MNIEEIREFIMEKAKVFGAQPETEYNKSYVVRNNTRAESLQDNGAYFGFIHPEEANSGPFHDFSLTIFPNNQEKKWLVCLGIGSSGFKNDYELAKYPGLRRFFSNLVDENGFCKSDFSDIETSLPKSFTSNQDLAHIKNTIKTYTKVLPVCQIVDPTSQDGLNVIAAFVAGYAKLRDWPSNSDQRKMVSDALKPFLNLNSVNETDEVEILLKQRKYVVLQGPPGTGKTRCAKEVAAKIKAKVFFTQFHAETSFSDFIYGIRPNTNGAELNYVEKPGIFVDAVRFAISNPDVSTVLIIDEINRANLSNILGPVFYLFEYKMDRSSVEVEISPGFKINQLPPNFYVIATMNSADRSLAVVDFALRRRFAWYSLKPKAINSPLFFNDDFLRVKEIFDWYASSDELSLQPGQGYFIADTKEEMTRRIQFEIFPLIKEYLQEGLMIMAKEEFNNYFMARINCSLVE